PGDGARVGTPGARAGIGQCRRIQPGDRAALEYSRMDMALAPDQVCAEDLGRVGFADQLYLVVRKPESAHVAANETHALHRVGEERLACIAGKRAVLGSYR